MIADLTEEMHGVAGLVASRVAAGGDATNTSTLLSKLASSMSAKIGQIPMLDPNNARILLEALTKSGYGERGSAVIVASIDAKLEQQLDDDPVVKCGNSNMLLLYPQNWVTEKFMATIDGS